MENGVAVGVQLPERNSDACFRLFKVFLDNSWTARHWKRHTSASAARSSPLRISTGTPTPLPSSMSSLIIYLSWKAASPSTSKLARAFLHERFLCGRRALFKIQAQRGQLAEGKCLFIDERLSRAMNKWSDCGLKPQKGPCLVGIV